MRNCPVTQCHYNKEGLCPKQSCSNWDLYREVTGECDTCNVAMKNHPKCDGCGILTGVGHEDFSSSYRGHNLCGHCVARWKRLDKDVGKKTTWGGFMRPDLLFAFPKAGWGYYIRGREEEDLHSLVQGKAN